MHAPTTDIKNAISYHKNIRLGFDSPSRLFFHYIVFRILHVLTRVCVYPYAQTSAARTAHRSSGNVTLHSARLWKVGWSDNHHQRRVRKGVCTYVAIAFLNAAMIFFLPSNVRIADCPPQQRSRIGSSVTLADCPPRQRSQKRISERKPSPEGKVARHLSRSLFVS